MALVELNLKAKKPHKYANIMSYDMAVYVSNLIPVGSQYTVSPPPADSDIDLLCLLPTEYWDSFLKASKEDGWEWENNYGGDFLSFRKDKINLIVTFRSSMFNKFKLAAEVCKMLNLTDKQHRIAVHNAIIYNELEIKKPKKKADALNPPVALNNLFIGKAQVQGVAIQAYQWDDLVLNEIKPQA